MRKPASKAARKATRKMGVEVLITEISNLRDSLELKQELTNLRIEVAQLRQELAGVKRGSRTTSAKKQTGLVAGGSSPTQD